MKAIEQTRKTFHLTLQEEEAEWLRGVMQNPLYGQTPEEESEEDNRMRRAFFDAVKSAIRIG